jgi:hypothetical protein
MQLLRVGLVQLLLLGTLILVPATPTLALELPDISVLSGESYPATAEGTVEGTEVAVFETELGEKLTSNKITFTIELLELSSLGPAVLSLTGVLEPKSKTFCHSIGEPEGTLTISGEYHVVDTSLSPLTVTHLFLFAEFLALCNKGKLLVKVRGPVVIKLEKLSSGTWVTAYGLVIQCVGKGKPQLREYLNDEGKSTKAVPTMNFGLGFESACLNVSKEVVMNTNKMLTFTF